MLGFIEQIKFNFNEDLVFIQKSNYFLNIFAKEAKNAKKK